MSKYNKALKDDDDLKLELVSLVNDANLSIAKAAKLVGISKRSAQLFFQKGTKWAEDWWNKQGKVEFIRTSDHTILLPNSPISTMLGQNKENNKPKVKILFFDIETAPCAGAVWGLWNNNIGLNQLERDWYVLSWAAKWQHEDVVHYQDKSSSWDNEDDSEMLVGIWELLNEADIVVGQNSRRFDEKKLNSRFIINGMQPPSSYRSIDTLEIAKRHFGFTSNKLEYMTGKLCKRYKKLTHGKFDGYELWKECLRGNPEAWAEMEEYNIHDVLALEELYDIMKPWYRSHPNLNVYTNDHGTTCVCGSSNFEHNGYHYTNLSKFDRFRCQDCGAEVRGRVNLLTQEKREFLNRNIV